MFLGELFSFKSIIILVISFFLTKYYFAYTGDLKDENKSDEEKAKLVLGYWLGLALFIFIIYYTVFVKYVF